MNPDLQMIGTDQKRRLHAIVFSIKRKSLFGARNCSTVHSKTLLALLRLTRTKYSSGFFSSIFSRTKIHELQKVARQKISDPQHLLGGTSDYIFYFSRIEIGEIWQVISEGSPPKNPEPYHPERITAPHRRDVGYFLFLQFLQDLKLGKFQRVARPTRKDVT